MNSFRMMVPLGYLALVALWVTPAHGQEKKPAVKEIDAATVAAYEKLGAEYVRFVKYPFYFDAPMESEEENGLPGFRFREFPKAKLPDVAVPFGLDFRERGVVTDMEMKELAGLKNLVWLKLSAYETVAGLKDLARLKGLRDLRLGRVDAADLKELAEFKQLAALRLSDITPRGGGLKELGSLVQLEELVLSNFELRRPKMGPSSLKELAGLKRLHTLHVNGHLTEKGLNDLREIGLLHAITNASGRNGTRPKSGDEVVSLVLERGMTSALTQTFSEFKNLESLRIRNLQFAEPRVKNDTHYQDLAAFLKDIAQFEKLAALELNTVVSHISGVGLAELGGFKQFTSLALARSNLSPKGITELASLTNLTRLDIADTPITDANLKELSSLKKLTSLNLNKTPVTNAGMKVVAGFKDLAKLSVAKTKVRDFGVKELAGLKELSSLDLGDTEVTDAALRELVGLKKLATLNLVGTRTTDAGIAELQKALPNCKIER